MLLADHQINAGDGQNDGKEDDRRRRSEGRITAAVAIEHVVNITYDGVHFRCVQIGTEDGHRVRVGLERTDKACDNQVEYGGGDHRQGDPGEDPCSGSAVHTGSRVVAFIHGGQRPCEDQHLEGHWPQKQQDVHSGPYH